VKKGLAAKRVSGREKTGTHLLKPLKRDQIVFSIFFWGDIWAFLEVYLIWIPVFFALSSNILRPESKVAKKPE